MTIDAARSARLRDLAGPAKPRALSPHLEIQDPPVHRIATTYEMRFCSDCEAETSRARVHVATVLNAHCGRVEVFEWHCVTCAKGPPP